MNIHRSLLTLVSLFCFWHANCQTQEEFDAFAQEVLDEAELLFRLARATELNAISNESERLAYKLSNDDIKSISWQSDSPNQILASIVYNPELEPVSQESNPREPNAGEKILISAYNKTQEIIDSGDLDFEGRITILKPIFIFQNQFENPDIEHSNTELIVYLIRDDADDQVVPMGGDFYLEFDGNGFLNDIYSIDEDYFHPEGSKIIEGEEVMGVIHGHSRTEDPIISATEICSILLHEDIITWEDLTVTRSYTDSTFTKTIYNIPSNTLTIEEQPNKEFNYNPTWAVLIRFGEQKYLEYFDSSDEISSEIFGRIDESWHKGIVVYEPEQARAQYPELTVGRLGLIEVLMKKSKVKLLPDEITTKIK
ncbi:hypothetical protein [Ekhidna sp.]|uniref:hypothetical protein n=1 Tax=Ekhidna sp. TaxID=2608089 RepID=UPI003B5AD88A